MINVFVKYLWLPFLVAVFLISFELKYDAVGLTFLFVVLQVVLFLNYSFYRWRAINLVSIYFLFSLIFLGLVPWVHYSGSHVIWKSNLINYQTYIFLNVLLAFSNMVVFIAYIYGIVKGSKILKSSQEKVRTKSVGLLLLSLSLASFFLLFYLNDFSVPQLLFRGVVDESRVAVVESSALSLLLNMTSRLVPVFCFLYSVTQLKGMRLLKFFLFLIMFFSVFPTGVARYLVAFAYIPVCLVLMPRFRSAALFSALLLLALLFLFPFLDQFRYFSGFSTLRFMPSAEFFYAAHFDAYENFASAIEGDFVTYGYQLLGVFLFFVPRVYWPDKPVGSGYEMASQLGYSFNNIAMPFLGEGFVNFGIPGVLVFSVFIGIALGRLDKKFITKKIPVRDIDYSVAIYFYLMGALFFMLRGDLLSSTAYISAGIFSAFMVKFLCQKV